MTIDLTDDEAKALRLAAREMLTNKYAQKKFKGKYDKQTAPLATALPKLEVKEALMV